MASLAHLPLETLETSPGHPEAEAALVSGQVLTWVRMNNPVERAATIEAVMHAVADLDTRFVRVGNPLRAPLTIERLLIQAGGPEFDVRHDCDPAALARLIAAPAGDETKVIVVVDQAETLDSEALRVLAAMAPHCATLTPRVQFLLSSNVPAPAVAPAAPPEAAPVQLTIVPPLLPAFEPMARMAAPPRRRLLPWLLCLLLLVAVSGAAVWFAYPGLFTRVLAPTPAAAMVTPGAPPPTVSATERVRQEFDDFLARSGQSTARLSEAQKGALFQEFLSWRRTQGDPAPR